MPRKIQMVKNPVRRAPQAKKGGKVFGYVPLIGPILDGLLGLGLKRKSRRSKK